MLKRNLKYINYFLILIIALFGVTNNASATWTYYNFSIPYTVSIPAPASPTNITATAGVCGTTNINISWTASAGATSYNVLRSTTSGGPYTTIASGLAGSPYSNTGLTPGTTYYYVVQAVNASGASPNSAQAFTVAPLGCTIADLTASTPTPASAMVGTPVTFSSNIQNIGTASTNTTFSNFFQLANAANGGGTLTDLASSTNIALPAGAGNASTSPAQTFAATGTYSVRACADKSNSASSGVIAESNETNNCSGWTNVSVTAAGPAAPTGVTAVAGTCGTGTINVSWNASVGATSYNVLRSTTSGSGYVIIANGITGTSYSNNSGLADGTTYFYVIQAVNAIGTSPNSAQAFAFTVAPLGCTIADLTASNPTPSNSSVGNPVSFKTTISNIGGASTGASFSNFFQLASAANGGGTLTDLASSTSVALTAGATNVITSPAQTFAATGTYSVRACADKSNSASSGVIAESNETNNCSGWTNVSVVVNLPPVVNAGIDQTIQLPTNSTSVSGTATDPDGSIDDIAWTFVSGPSTPTISTPSIFTTSINGLTTMGTYTFRLTVTDNQSAAASDDVNITVTAIVPIPPTGVGATAGVCGTHAINLVWNASVGATSYNVLRSTTSGSGYVSIASGITGTSYSDTSVTPGTRYYYVIQAISSAGTSPNSLQVTAIAPAVCNIADLTAAGPTPSSAIVSVPTAFSSTISNIGSASTGTSFSNLFQVATAPNGGGTLSTISVNTLAALGAGANSIVTSSSYSFPTIGTYSVRTCADLNDVFVGSIPESNETNVNNCSTWINVTVNPSLSCTTSGSGSGLTGNYYDGIDLTTFVTTHIDPTINFIPASSLGINYANSPDGATFSTDWQGQVQPKCTENYTFFTYTDDGVRLWVNGSLVIDKWVNQGGTEWSSASIPLNAGVKYDIKLDYFNNLGDSSVRLSWASPSTTKQVIPQSQLYVTSFADLTASAPTPAGASVGVPAVFTSTISNVGGASTGASFSNFFQLASAANGGGTLTDLASSTNIALAGGAGNPANSPAHTFATVGTYSIRACADKTNSASSGVISESDETNNCSPWTNVIVSASPPPAPTGVIAVAGTCGTTSINVSWSATPGATAYNVLRSTVSGGPYAMVASSIINTSYIDNSGLTGGTTYYYVVQAVNASGASPNSAQAFTPASVACNAPDLIPSAATPSNATVGTPVVFSSTISNIGATSTGTSFFNFFQVATAANGGGVVADLAPSSMATLASGSGSTTTSPPYTFSLSGTYSVRACADKTDRTSLGVIAEANEANNCSNTWNNVTVTGTLPPPSVSLIANPTSIIAGQSSILTWSSSGADSCVGTNFSTGASNATSNSTGVSVSPIATTTYGLTCTNTSTGLDGTSFVTINVDAKKIPIYTEP